MKKYGIYEMFGDAKRKPKSAMNAYDMILVDNSNYMLEQFDELDDSKKALEKFKSTTWLYSYFTTVWICDIFYVAENVNISDEDEKEDIVSGDIVVFSEFDKEEEDEECE